MSKIISSGFRQQLLLLIAAGLMVRPFPCSADVQPPNATRPNPQHKPNIIFILADDLGYGDVGCFGQKKIKTPGLDQMALEGMRFTSAYAGSTVCAPSRCALMTGLHSGHGWIRGNSTLALRPEDVTVAQVLKQAGYRTSLVGKWGLGLEGSTGIPGRQGFDEWFGYLDQQHAHNYYPEFLWRGDSQGTEVRVPLEKNQNGQKGDYSHDKFTREALSFVNRNKDHPFFLYLAYTIPHANNELKSATGNGMETPDDSPYAHEPWPQPEKNKAAMISRLDRDVGILLAKLKDLNIDDHTVVFFSSDNGPHKEGGNDPDFFESRGPLRGLKRDLYEGGIRVPALVRWPGKIKPRTVSDLPWAFWDFLPTAAEIAGVKPPPNLDGLSILPTLLGRKQSRRHEFLYWEFHERGSKQAVRMGDWKAVRLSPGQPLELYNLKTDPGEEENVAGKNPGILAKIEAYLKTARTESTQWPLKPAEEKK